MKTMKRVLSLLLVVTCIAQVCLFSFPTSADDSSNQRVDTVSSEGIVADNKSDWSYVSIAGTTETAMVYNASTQGMVIANPATNDQYAKFTTVGNGNSHPANSCDIAIVYNVKTDGKLDLGLSASVHNAGGDGVKVKVYLNTASNELLTPTVVVKADGKKEFSVLNTEVKAGDKIYFVLNKNNSLSTDGGTFVASVKTSEEQQSSIIDTKSTDGIVADNKSDWNYVSIVGTTETAMIHGMYSNTYPAMLIDNPAANDQYARLLNDGGSHPSNSGDIAAVYNVKKDVVLDCSITAKVNNANSDGIRIKAWVNSKENYILIPTVILSTDGQVTYEMPSITVKTGDKIYFAFDKNNGLSNDAGKFIASVKESSKLNANKKYSGNVMASQADYGYSYQYIAEDGTQTAMSYAVATSSYMNGYSGKSYTTAGDATAFFNDKYQVGAAGEGYLAHVYTVSAEGKINLSLSAKTNNTSTYNGDGYGIAIAINDCMKGGLEDWKYFTSSEAKEGVEKKIEKSVQVKAGDKIYFLFTKAGGKEGEYTASYDVAIFKTSITYSEMGNIKDEDRTQGNVELIKYEDSNAIKVGKTYKSSENIGATLTDNFSYKYVTGLQNEISDMLYDSETESYRKTLDKNQVDYGGYFAKNKAGTASDGDVLTVYTMPIKAKISVEILVRVEKEQSDGVAVSIARNELTNVLHKPQVVTYSQDAQVTSIKKEIIAGKDDNIFIRLNKNVVNSYDSLQFDVIITYLELNPDEDATEGEYIHPLVNTKTDFKTALGKNDSTVWNYQKIENSTNEISDMICEKVDDVYTYRCSANSEDADYWGSVDSTGVMRSAVSYDVLVVYTAPEKVKINATWNAEIAREKSDGAVFSVFRNKPEYVIGDKTVLRYEDGKQALEYKSLVLNKGDKLYFRLNKNISNSYDSIVSNIIIEYMEVNPTESATEGTYVHPLTGTTTDFKSSLSVNEKGVWSYKKIKNSDGKISNMSYEYTKKDNRHAYRCSLDTKNVDYWGSVDSTGVIGTANSYDVLIVYTAPEKVKINATWNAEIAREKSDGAVFSVFRNEFTNAIGKRTVLRYEDGKQSLEYNNLILNKGDKLYFRLNKKGTNSYDSIVSNIIIKYLEVNPKGKATQGNTGLIIEEGTEILFNQDSTEEWGNNGFYYYASKIGTEDYHKLVYDKELECYVCPKGNADDEWVRIGTTGTVRTGNKYDAILVYQVQKNAQITVNVKCKSLATNGDGVRVKLLHNGQKIAPVGQRWQVVFGDNQFSYKEQLKVAKGEYIMLRVNRNFLNSYDNMDLDFSITYDKIYDKAPEGSIQGVQLPTCKPYAKEAKLVSTNDPRHTNRTPFEGEVPGLKGKAKVVEPVSAEIPRGYGGVGTQSMILIMSAIAIALILGGGYIFILLKKQNKVRENQ